jgi:biotin carboxyl carrier protein
LAAGGKSRIVPAMKRELVVESNGGSRTVLVESKGDGGSVQVTIDGVVREVDARRIRPGTWSLIIDHRAHLVDLEPRRGGAVEVTVGPGVATLKVEDARARRLASAAKRERAVPRGETVAAPIAGRIVKVHFAVGDTVPVGASVIVLEAMKMENELISERGGTITKIYRAAGESVDTGEKLVELA